MAERKKVLLRLDPDVYAAIARWAADDLRSVNSQIEYALRQALRTVNRPVRPSWDRADENGDHENGDDEGDGAGPEPADDGPMV